MKYKITFPNGEEAPRYYSSKGIRLAAIGRNWASGIYPQDLDRINDKGAIFSLRHHGYTVETVKGEG